MGIARTRRARYSRGYFGRNTTRHYRHYSRSPQQALDGYSWGYSWVLGGRSVFWTPQESRRARARVRTLGAARSLGKLRRVSPHAHKLSHANTRLPACTHAHTHCSHFGFYLRRSLCTVGGINEVCRCCCRDTHLMHVSRLACVRVRVRVLVMNVCMCMALCVCARACV